MNTILFEKRNYRIRQIEIKARKKLRFNDKNTGLKDFLR